MMHVPQVACAALLLGLWGCAGAGARAPSEAQSPMSRPNILLITADDMGPQTGAYGDPMARTPHLDRLASEGMRFENAYVTQASCSPSRSSMLTGLYPHQNGQIALSHRGYTMREGIMNLPAALQQAGYRTGILGKLHVEPAEEFPFDLRNTATAPTRHVVPTAEAAEAFMGEGERPFFLMVNFTDPHVPFQSQVDGVPENPHQAGTIHPFAFQGALDTPVLRERVAGYYNGVARVDAGVGLLLRALDATEQAENTLVIFLGDHGPPFVRGKASNYEAGVRIPFLVRYPGVGRPGVREELVSTIDILPTILDVIGAPARPELPGASLTGLLSDTPTAWREVLVTEFTAHDPRAYFPVRAIRDQRYKLILNLLPDRSRSPEGIDADVALPDSRLARYDGTLTRRIFERYHRPPAVELYDLTSDPHEYHNLAGQAEHRAAQRRLERALRAWQERTEDPLRHPDALSSLTRFHDHAIRNCAEAGELRCVIRPALEGGLPPMPAALLP